MKTLYAFGEEYQVERITKDDEAVRGYIGGKEILKFTGVNHDHFSLGEGEEWDEIEPTVEESLSILQTKQQETDLALLAFMKMNTSEGV